MKIYTGTSGYGYEEWKGSFYPEKLPAGEMLAYYAGKLGSVEINNTFYRIPNIEVVGAWAGQVPRGFVFAVKAPRVITHIKRLRNVGEEVRRFLGALSWLGNKLGAVLFQFPGGFSEDRELLEKFLRLLPPGTRCAFEFRNASWLNGGTYDLLNERGFALCDADTDEKPADGPSDAGAQWGYLRLRRRDYSDADLSRWADGILSRKWKRAFVFFKHEEDEAAAGPGFARRFSRLVRDKQAALSEPASLISAGHL